ncbi:MAG: hypothetical protein M1587_08470, partial [Thaumarchaeota archaeon]|nr:hypothetical protein [Nitrososphaerota archaeon]
MSQQTLSIDEQLVESLSASLNEPKWLRDFRMSALRDFNVLPEEQSNLYVKHSQTVGKQLSAMQSLTDSTPASDALPLSEIASGMESGQYYVSTQSETIASKNVRSLESKGVIFCDFHEALEKHANILR